MTGLGRSPARPWTAAAVLCTGFFMVILDTTIVTVALPTIDEDLGFALSDLAWVVNAYLVAFAGLLLLAGRLGDLVGRRRVFVAGLAVFVAASALCAAARTPEQLIAARFAQGAGGAMATAVILGMLVALFPEPRDRARAIGAYSFVGAAGSSLGLTAGGALTDALGWSAVFLVNVPVGAAMIAMALRTLAPDATDDARGAADAPGAVLIVASLMIAVTAIVGVEQHGVGSARTLGLGAVALGLMLAFLARERAVATPLVPLCIFRLRALSAANGVQLFMVAGYFGQQFLVALYLQRVLGFAPREVGLAMLPIAATIAAVSLAGAPRLIARAGAVPALLAGLVLAAASLALLGRAPGDASYAVDVLPALLALGVGAGLSMPALMTIAMSATRTEDAGLASGLLNTTQQVGAALGFAVVATAAAARTAGAAASGEDATAALAAGYRVGFLVAAGAVVAAIGIAVAGLRTRAGEPATA